MDKKSNCGIIYNNFLIFLKRSTVFVVKIVLWMQRCICNFFIICVFALLYLIRGFFYLCDFAKPYIKSNFANNLNKK